jgi:hypothetical protein
MEHVSLRYSRPLVSCYFVNFHCFWFNFTAPTDNLEPPQVDTATQAQDDDNANWMLNESRPDEDINEEIVHDPNVLAEVTLPSRICQLQFFMRMTLLNVSVCTDQRWTLDNAAQKLLQPMFPTLVKKFLYQQLYPDSEISFSDALKNLYLEINGRIHVRNSAVTTFRAPSDISGIYGMRREHIRAISSWRGGPPRYDCVLVNSDPDIEGTRGFEVARVFLFFSFQHQNKMYPCALIQWYSYVGNQPDEDTGLWKIEPDTEDDGNPHLAVIHLDTIFRAVHLIPAYRTAEFISRTITMHSSLDSFNIFYVNRFADHHLFANLL